ncbi:hypothetical protein Btru_074181 [Bulinus truncatus]|nr:hypothetical protein Btru_074181 [Bulinus truncatus]
MESTGSSTYLNELKKQGQELGYSGKELQKIIKEQQEYQEKEKERAYQEQREREERAEKEKERAYQEQKEQEERAFQIKMLKLQAQGQYDIKQLEDFEKTQTTAHIQINDTVDISPEQINSIFTKLDSIDKSIQLIFKKLSQLENDTIIIDSKLDEHRQSVTEQLCKLKLHTAEINNTAQLLKLPINKVKVALSKDIHTRTALTKSENDLHVSMIDKCLNPSRPVHYLGCIQTIKHNKVQPEKVTIPLNQPFKQRRHSHLMLSNNKPLVCYICHSLGHKATFCNRRFRHLTCFRCFKKGHIQKYCRFQFREEHKLNLHRQGYHSGQQYSKVNTFTNTTNRNMEIDQPRYRHKSNNKYYPPLRKVEHIDNFNSFSLKRYSFNRNRYGEDHWHNQYNSNRYNVDYSHVNCSQHKFLHSERRSHDTDRFHRNIDRNWRHVAPGTGRPSEDHPTSIDDHSTSIDDHSTSIDDHSTGIDDHSTGIDDHSTGIDDHSTSIMSKRCRLS